MLWLPSQLKHRRLRLEFSEHCASSCLNEGAQRRYRTLIVKASRVEVSSKILRKLVPVLAPQRDYEARLPAPRTL